MATKIPGQWQKVLEAGLLQRSSQVLSLIDGTAYVFGGELRPREPRDNDVHAITLTGAPTLTTTTATPHSPSPRVGTASTTLHNKLYIFSGRGGVAMAPIDEAGSLWEFNPSTSTWTHITPSQSTDPYPAARSYHAMTSDGTDKLYIHAGCPEKGRLSDLWSFSLSTRTWTELAPAPDPPRGGTSIAFAAGLLYRMNGFDGTSEQGGSVDVYTPETNEWVLVSYTPDGVQGPVSRSVGALVPVTHGGGGYLVTLFGERDPSSLGHQGAGKMLGDVWVFEIEGRVWREVEVGGEGPDPRGWFDADVVEAGRVVVHGGLGESNERLGDVWVLTLG
ncbi:galactose oxidase [Aspergillus ellipticus CBS 707.79]|uniref:Galactose oxidase n=1 Tax=Aspergillus ellipticus CBS 707.79 TaxID=1448320 RepID=A0A319DU85_9EURO|nr:galactose oxidase [Aspergillus ellipticus CBS 707.79]